MSVLAHLPLRRVANDSHDSKKSHDVKDPKEGFKELLKAMPVDESSRGKDFFTLIAEEEEEEIEPKEGPACEMRNHADLSLAQAKAMSISVSRLAQLSPAIEAAFEKMASCMIVMTSTQERETTLFLDNPHFASSSLFGTQITIREFSTAPKAFNIEILSNPQGVALIDSSKSELLSAFQNGNFSFTVHRLDTLLHQREDRPVLHRRENEDREHKDQGGNSHE
jgi:hypothetical protein